MHVSHTTEVEQPPTCTHTHTFVLLAAGSELERFGTTINEDGPQSYMLKSHEIWNNINLFVSLRVSVVSNIALKS